MQQLQQIVRRTIGAWISRRLRRKPMIVPVVVENSSKYREELILCARLVACHSEKAGSIRCVYRLLCICRTSARKLRESERGRGEAPHQRPISALIDTGRGALFSSLITKESVH